MVNNKVNRYTLDREYEETDVKETTGFKSANITIEDEYHLANSIVKKAIPKAIRRKYGCRNCIKRIQGLCPFGFTARDKDKVNQRKDSNGKVQGLFHIEGYCSDWMSELYHVVMGNPQGKVPGSGWRTCDWWDLQIQKKFMAQEVLDMLKELTLLKMKQSTILDNPDSTKEQIASIKEEVKDMRLQYKDLGLPLAWLHDKQVYRETPKQVEITHDSKITHTQMDALRNGDITEVIDIDIDGEDKDE